MKVILSIFPGIGLLDRAFEEVFDGEACIVRGPDLLWGGDVKKFQVPPSVFWGVIGGPPCQAFSRLVHIVRAKGQQTKPNLIPEYERIVREAQTEWFMMENVPAAPEPVVDGYVVRSIVFNNRWSVGAPEQNRVRRFSFGTRDGRRLIPDVCLFENPLWGRAVVASSSKEGALAKSQQELRDGISPRLRRKASVLAGQTPRRTIQRCLELQGWPMDLLDEAPFTMEGKYRVVGNGVPRWMGLTIARAVREAMH